MTFSQTPPALGNQFADDRVLRDITPTLALILP